MEKEELRYNYNEKKQKNRGLPWFFFVFTINKIIYSKLLTYSLLIVFLQRETK